MVEGTDLYGDGVNIAARLETLAEPGGICISSSIHEQVKGKLAIGFDDLGRKSLKNMVEPVQIYRARRGAAVEASGKRSMREALVLPAKPSIAVLPLTNMSEDVEQQYFCDGLTEDIITELSRFRQLFVIARNSAFQYRGDVDVKQVGRELGVRYVVEGSIRRAAERVRITAQLIDAATGSHIWAERYDRSVQDVFAVQDEVTKTIVATLAIRLDDEGLAIANRKAPHDADMLIAKAMMLSSQGEAGTALELALSAIRLNPHHPDYYLAYMAHCYLMAKRYEEAKELSDGLSALPEGRALLAVICVKLEQLKEAQYHAERFVRDFPIYWTGRVRASFVTRNLFHYKNAVDADMILNALIEAGVPEG